MYWPKKRGRQSAMKTMGHDSKCACALSQIVWPEERQPPVFMKCHHTNQSLLLESLLSNSPLQIWLSIRIQCLKICSSFGKLQLLKPHLRSSKKLPAHLSEQIGSQLCYNLSCNLDLLPAGDPPTPSTLAVQLPFRWRVCHSEKK